MIKTEIHDEVGGRGAFLLWKRVSIKNSANILLNDEALGIVLLSQEQHRDVLSHWLCSALAQRH